MSCRQQDDRKCWALFDSHGMAAALYCLPDGELAAEYYTVIVGNHQYVEVHRYLTNQYHLRSDHPMMVSAALIE